MKYFIGYIRSEILRLLRGNKFYLSIILYILAVQMILKLESVGRNIEAWRTYQALSYISGLSNINRLLFFLAAMSTCTIYVEDISNKYQNFQVIRGKINSYILSRITICGFISFLIPFISLNLVSIILTCKYGMGILDSGNYRIDNVFFGYMSCKMPYITIIAMIFLFSLVSSVYAILGLVFTTYIKGKFAAYFSPVFVSIVAETFFRYMPKSISLFAIQSGNNAYMMGANMTMLLSVSVCMGYIMISGIIFSRRVKRRIHNEIN